MPSADNASSGPPRLPRTRARVRASRASSPRDFFRSSSRSASSARSSFRSGAVQDQGELTPQFGERLVGEQPDARVEEAAQDRLGGAVLVVADEQHGEAPEGGGSFGSRFRISR